MTERMPALSLAAVPGRRAGTVQLAAEIEQRGFSGIYCPSFGDALGLCLSIAHATSTIEFGTSIQPIYLQHPMALATTASYLHEIADGRFTASTEFEIPYVEWGLDDPSTFVLRVAKEVQVMIEAEGTIVVTDETSR